MLSSAPTELSNVGYNYELLQVRPGFMGVIEKHQVRNPASNLQIAAGGYRNLVHTQVLLGPKALSLKIFGLTRPD